jgi:hypothetical protein
VFGYAYNVGIQTVSGGSAPPLASSFIKFSNTGPSGGGVGINGSNDALVLPITGTYESIYTVEAATPAFGSFKLVQTSGSTLTTIPGSVSSGSAGSVYTGNSIFTALSGDQVSIANNSIITSKLSSAQIIIGTSTGKNTLGASLNVPLTIPTSTSSNSVYVAVQTDNGNTISTIQDSASSTNYIFINSVTSNTQTVYLYYLDNLAAGSTHIQIITTGSLNPLCAEYVILSNTATPSYLASSSAVNSGSSITPSVTVATTSINQIIIAATLNNSTPSNGSLNILTRENNTSFWGTICDAQPNAIGSFTGTITSTSSGNWGAVAAVVQSPVAGSFAEVSDNASLSVQLIS